MSDIDTIKTGMGVFGKMRDDGKTDKQRLNDQIFVWDLIKRNFIKSEFHPQIVLLNVDPWPNRPPMQLWLDEHVPNLYRRNRNKVELDIRCLEISDTMDLFTNLMRTISCSASGGDSASLPQIYNLIIKVESVTTSDLDAFLCEFEYGGVWGKGVGSLPSSERKAIKKFLETSDGRIVIHPTLGLTNIVSFYCSEPALTKYMSCFSAHLARWHGRLN